MALFLSNSLAAASSKNQQRSPLVGLTLAAGSGKSSLPSITLCKEMLNASQQNNNQTTKESLNNDI